MAQAGRHFFCSTGTYCSHLRLLIVSKSAEVHKILIFILSLMVLTSSCAMTKLLWEQMGIESAVPTKSYPSKAISALCLQTGDSVSDVAEVTANSTVKAPLLLSILLVLSLISPRRSEQPGSNFFDLDFSNNTKVPIYLRLGRLIYYS